MYPAKYNICFQHDEAAEESDESLSAGSEGLMKFINKAE